MKPFDPDGGDDAGDWRAEFNAWKLEVAAARRAQVAALNRLRGAETKLAALTAWRDQFAAAIAAASGRLAPYAAVNATIADLSGQIDSVDLELSDRLAARDAATTQVIDGPPAATPLVLLPMRVHTAWLSDGLAVRFVPSDLSVDRHDPRLTALEVTLGQAYWATRGLAATADLAAAQADQAWRDLTNRVPPPRAAWIARATKPGAPAPAVRADELDLPVMIRALPNRFAVVLLTAGEPVDVAPDGQPPRFVTWSADVPRDLPVPVLHAPEDRPWTDDLEAAVGVGMAVRLAAARHRHGRRRGRGRRCQRRLDRGCARRPAHGARVLARSRGAGARHADQQHRC